MRLRLSLSDRLWLLFRLIAIKESIIVVDIHLDFSFRVVSFSVRKKNVRKSVRGMRPGFLISQFSNAVFKGIESVG